MKFFMPIGLGLGTQMVSLLKMERKISMFMKTMSMITMVQGLSHGKQKAVSDGQTTPLITMALIPMAIPMLLKCMDYAPWVMTIS